MKNKHIRLIVELMIFSFFIGFPLLIYSAFKESVGEEHLLPLIKGVLLTHVLLIVFYYFNSYFALPKFYFRQKFGVYVTIVLSCLVGLVLLLQFDKRFNPINVNDIPLANIFFNLSIIVRFAMIFLLSMGFATYQRLKETEQEKLKTELSYLKAQINPHFLFNTLNSIYALTVKKSDNAPESVTKLSAIMRYVITDAAQDFVSLEKELNYISSYINLEKLRLTNKVILNYTNSCSTAGLQIAPLIFIPLIENAFKYGVSATGDSRIDVEITTEGKTLKLKIINTIARLEKKSNTGLGIENVKKRLALLYPGKHDLNIAESEKQFSVQLNLRLND